MHRISERLSSYRPALDRAIFGLAILGLLNSAHIFIQQQGGFEQGCTGFSTSLFAGPAFDCGAVTGSAAGAFLGVSTSLWGVGFYLLIAALTAAAAFNVRNRLPLYKSIRSVLVAAGMLFTLYLLYYQYFVLEQLCVLCLLSAGIVAALFVLHIVDVRRSSDIKIGPTERMTPKPAREIAYMGALVAILVVLVGADAVYFRSQEAPDVFAQTETSGPSVVADVGNGDGQPDALPPECGYDLEKGRVQDYGRLVEFFDPMVGDPDAPVTVIEYFDPNCPHCKTIHSVMMPVVRSHSDQARFVFKPFVLWRHSVAQSEALYAAAQEGKFFEMLALQYEMQQPQTGLGPDQLRSIADQIGMDPDHLMQRLNSGVYQRTLAQEKQEAIDIGVTSTPTVLINGRFVDSDSRTVDCLRKMIEQAAEG